jgi:hypothetical protein
MDTSSFSLVRLEPTLSLLAVLNGGLKIRSRESLTKEHISPNVPPVVLSL